MVRRRGEATGGAGPTHRAGRYADGFGRAIAIIRVRCVDIAERSARSTGQVDGPVARVGDRDGPNRRLGDTAPSLCGSQPHGLEPRGTRSASYRRTNDQHDGQAKRPGSPRSEPPHNPPEHRPDSLNPSRSCPPARTRQARPAARSSATGIAVALTHTDRSAVAQPKLHMGRQSAHA